MRLAQWSTGQKLLIERKQDGWVVRVEYLDPDCHASVTKLRQRRKEDRLQQQQAPGNPAQNKPTRSNSKPAVAKPPGLSPIAEVDTEETTPPTEPSNPTDMPSTRDPPHTAAFDPYPGERHQHTSDVQLVP